MLRAVLDRHRYEVHNTYIDSFCAECDKFFEGEYTTLTLTLSVLNVTSSLKVSCAETFSHVKTFHGHPKLIYM